MALETRGMTSNLEIEGARRAEVSQQSGGLSVDRRLTSPGEEPLEAVEALQGRIVLNEEKVTDRLQADESLDVPEHGMHGYANDGALV